MSLKKNYYFLFLFLVLNCASVLSKNKYIYNVNSVPVDSSVEIMESDSTIGKFKTPGKILVPMKGDIVLRFEAKGYQEKYYFIEKDVNGWFWFNLLLGTPVGTPAILYDYWKGSMYKPRNGITDISVILEPVKIPLEEIKKK